MHSWARIGIRPFHKNQQVIRFCSNDCEVIPKIHINAQKGNVLIREARPRIQYRKPDTFPRN